MAKSYAMKAVVWLGWLVLGCGSTVQVIEDGGSSADGGAGSGAGSSVGGDSSTGGGGGEVIGPSGPRTITLEADLCAGCEIFYVVSDAAGERKAVYRETELPTLAEVDDGDLITLVDNQRYSLRSARVRPGVTRVHQRVRGWNHVCSHDDCCEPGTLAAPMDITLRTPPSSLSTSVEMDPHPASGLWLGSDDEETYTVTSCDPDAVVRMKVVRHESGGTPSGINGDPAAFEVIELPYRAGEHVEVFSALDQNPRTSMRFDLDGLSGMTLLVERSGWYSRDDPFSSLNHDEFPDESDSLTWQATPPLLPFGESWAFVSATTPELAGWCGHVEARQFGNRPSAMRADLTELATLIPSTEGWDTLQPGESGTVVERWASHEDIWHGDIGWLVVDDPSAEPMPIVLPEVDDLATFSAPDSNELEDQVSHRRMLWSGSYAELVANPEPSAGAMVMRSTYLCDR